MQTYQPNGRKLVQLNSTAEGNGIITTHHSHSSPLVELGATVDGEGTVKTYQPNGKELVSLSASALGNGGLVYVYNKTGESIAQMYADDYGNGVVWAGNRKGMGRELKPGP